MSCFCQTSMAPLSSSLPALDLSASGALSLSASAQTAISLDTWLSARAGIAALNPAWLSVSLPSVDLSANALATISAMAQLRAQTLAGLGIDLAAPGPAAGVAFTRVAATLDARMAALDGAADVPMGGWGQLASLNAALMRLQSAVQSGTVAGLDLSAGSSLTLAPVWPPFFAQLAPLAALLGAMAQLNASAVGSGAGSLGTSLGAMANVQMPALPSSNLMAMCQLSASLSSVAQLQSGLGVDPLQLGFPAVRAMVAANLSATLSALTGAGVSLSPDMAASLVADLPTVPPFANAATVRAAMALDVSALAGQDGSALPGLDEAADVSGTLRAGLSVSALSSNLSTALGVSPSTSPCPTCDCRAIVAALG